MKLSEIKQPTADLPLDISMLFKLHAAHVPIYMLEPGRRQKMLVHDPELGATEVTGRPFLRVFLSTDVSTDSRLWVGNEINNLELKKRDGTWMLRFTERA